MTYNPPNRPATMSPLERAQTVLEFQYEAVKAARGPYKLKAAEEKHRLKKLISNAPGKSHAEKETNAYASEEWLQFSRELASLETKFEDEMLKFKVIEYDWQTRHLFQKQDENLIRKQR